ncbi:hypothetical protein TthSNM11_25370 (plasmid) [Thermus thermophilus]|jgi:hypothetical protein|uniref:Uncharacterized protein n=1 Tax=Thermus sp. WG TaxID=1312524 RepID=R4JHE8_9DEIN|nr:hypothetical protein WG16_09 [Thermus sp. WG]BDG20334.1 hypothetical protein TthSNM11_25370 [Thermus thermophilus]
MPGLPALKAGRGDRDESRELLPPPVGGEIRTRLPVPAWPSAAAREETRGVSHTAGWGVSPQAPWGTNLVGVAREGKGKNP